MTPEELAARLPPGFVLGTATAATQVEGSTVGKPPSTWDTFAAQPGRVIDGSTPALATDSWRRWEDDVALLADLGVDGYRFSLAWSRVCPDGRRVDQAALDHYSRWVDALLDNGIRPMVTLFHWDTPEPLEAAGGWLRRETAERFGAYADTAGRALGDRVADWVTLNEPATVLLNGYGLGLHAPGRALLFKAIPAVRHLLLGHGLAVQALRAVPVSGRIGTTNVHTPCVPATDTTDDRLAADALDFLHNRLFADPVLLGRPGEVPAALPLRERLGLRWLSRIPRRDLATIAQPLDFYGLNYYFPSRVAAGPDPTGASPDGESEAMKDVPFHLEPWPDLPVTGFGWPVAPAYLTRLLHDLSERYADHIPPVVITEGGASFPDEVVDGEVHDEDRIAYLAAHLAAATEAVPGVEVQGYYVWTLLDNWEWAAGFTQRFGLVHVDHETQVRTPKRSFHWLRELQRARRPAS